MNRIIYAIITLSLLFMGQTKVLAQTSETLRVWMDNITLTADGETVTKLKVYQHDEQDYASFNMSFIVPEGITIAQIKSGRGNNITYKNDISLSERAADSHNITANQPSTTLIKVACIGSEGENLYPTDLSDNPLDELFTIGLVASHEMINGTYTIEVGDLNFGLIIDENGNMADVKMTELPSFQLTITGGQDALTVPYTLTSAGVGTLCLPFAANLPEGIQVWKGTSVVGSKLQMERQTSIEAGVPLIVTGEAGTYEFRGVPSVSTTEFSEGILRGTTVERQLAEGYVLQTLGGVTGFYKVDESQPVTMPPFRAWLIPDATQNVKMVSLDWTTAIVKPNNWELIQAKDIYDMGGRKMKNTSEHQRKLPHGVYVVDGQKWAK